MGHDPDTSGEVNQTMRSVGSESPQPNVITNVEDLYSDDHAEPEIDPSALTKSRSKKELDRVASHLIIENKNKPKDKKPW